MRLICQEATERPSSLCVLGAGNCNDLDLVESLTHFDRVELVDLDSAALRAGVERQAVPVDKIVQHGGVDVTGVADRMWAWSPNSAADDDEVESCLEAVGRARIELPGGFQVTASGCLLSQLIESVVVTLGETHPRFLEVLTAIRSQHLRLLLDLTASGGTAILFADVVSSSTCPQLLSAHGAELPQVVGQAISARNFFTGMNPFVLKSLFESDPHLARRVESVDVSNPWLWDLGPRAYAVCAIRVRRACIPHSGTA
jgi:hypothetical protein